MVYRVVPNGIRCPWALEAETSLEWVLKVVELSWRKIKWGVTAGEGFFCLFHRNKGV